MPTKTNVAVLYSNQFKELNIMFLLNVFPHEADIRSAFLKNIESAIKRRDCGIENKGNQLQEAIDGHKIVEILCPDQFCDSISVHLENGVRYAIKNGLCRYTP